jgi:hypothetical protein
MALRWWYQHCKRPIRGTRQHPVICMSSTHMVLCRWWLFNTLVLVGLTWTTRNLQKKTTKVWNLLRFWLDSAQFSDEHCQGPRCYDWSKSHKEEHTELNKCHIQTTKNIRESVNAEQIKSLIRGNLCTTIREMAKTVGIRIGCVETITYNELNVSKVSAHWVPSDEQNERWVKISSGLLGCFEREGKQFMHSIVTYDEMWVHYFTPHTKNASMEW